MLSQSDEKYKLDRRRRLARLKRNSLVLQSFLLENSIDPKVFWQRVADLKKETDGLIDCSNTKSGKICKGQCCSGCYANMGYLGAVQTDKTRYYRGKFTHPKGFLTENGCSLPREERSLICVGYFCEKIWHGKNKKKMLELRNNKLAVVWDLITRAIQQSNGIYAVTNSVYKQELSKTTSEFFERAMKVLGIQT